SDARNGTRASPPTPGSSARHATRGRATTPIDRARPFADRREGGAELAARLQHYRGRDDVVVLGLPRGGVPVAFEVAQALVAPLDVFVVRKLGMPGHPEFAMGAIASGGVQVLSDDIVRWYCVPQSAIGAVAHGVRA